MVVRVGPGHPPRIGRAGDGVLAYAHGPPRRHRSRPAARNEPRARVHMALGAHSRHRGILVEQTVTPMGRQLAARLRCSRRVEPGGQGGDPRRRPHDVGRRRRQGSGPSPIPAAGGGHGVRQGRRSRRASARAARPGARRSAASRHGECRNGCSHTACALGDTPAGSVRRVASAAAARSLAGGGAASGVPNAAPAWRAVGRASGTANRTTVTGAPTTGRTRACVTPGSRPEGMARPGRGACAWRTTAPRGSDPGQSGGEPGAGVGPREA